MENESGMTEGFRVYLIGKIVLSQELAMRFDFAEQERPTDERQSQLGGQ